MFSGMAIAKVGAHVGSHRGSRPDLPAAKREVGRALSPFDQLKALLRPRRKHQSQAMTEDHIVSILILRRARDEMLGTSLFAEPAWDVLLELYAASLGGRRMSLRDVALAIKVPESTAARWIAALADHGLICSQGAPDEGGAAWIDLTERGTTKMKRLADHWQLAFMSI
jgi:DNA-binding MarR family transcriptional regulator